MKIDKGRIATTWLSDPAVMYVILGLVTVGAVYFFLPSLYRGTKDAAKTAFNDLSSGVSDAVDGTFSQVSSIVGKPSSDAPNRPASDTFKGLFSIGDRALSDLADWWS